MGARFAMLARQPSRASDDHATGGDVMAGLAGRIWLLAVLAAVVAVGAIAAIALTLDDEGERAPAVAVDEAAAGAATGAPFWDAVRLDASDRLFAPTLVDLVAQSDVAVLGTVVDVRVNRVVEGDIPDARAVFAVADLRVERVVAGALDRPAEVIGVKLAVAGAYEEALAGVRRAAAGLPRGPVLAFLVGVDRELARQASAGSDPREVPEQAGLYIPHSSVGVFAATDRAAVDTPLGDPPTAGAHPYREELSGIRSVEALADRIAATATGAGRG